MADTQSSDIVIVGAGPVGLFLALRLAQLSIPVVVLEQAYRLTHTPKAYVYQPFLFPEFQKAGVLDDFRAQSATKNDPGSLTFRTPADEAKSIIYEIKPPPGGSIGALKLPQYEVCQILLRHLAKYDNVKVLMGHWVQKFEEKEDGIEVTAQIFPEGPRKGVFPSVAKFHAKYLVGADGGRSSVRVSSGIDLKGESLPHHLVALDIRYPFEKHDGMAGVNFLIDPKYYGVWGPIDNHGLWRVSYGLPVGRDWEKFDEEQLRATIPEYLDAILPGPKPLQYDVVHVAGYRAHQLYAETFRKGRVLLVGDAAHSEFPMCLFSVSLTKFAVTNPFMALGLVSGIYDAATLASVLESVMHRAAPDVLLDSWAQARLKVFTNVVDPLSRAAFHAAQMDGLNNKEQVIQAHPTIRRFETIKEIGSKWAPPPINTDLSSLEGWVGQQEQSQEEPNMGLMYQRVLSGMQGSLMKIPNLLTSKS